MSSGWQGRGYKKRLSYTHPFGLWIKVYFGGENTSNNFTIFSERENIRNTYLLFLLVEIIYDDTNKQVQGEEGPKDDENNKVKIHV